VEIELRSGQLRVLSLSASVLRSPGSALQGGVIVFRDITGQRDLERLREDIFAMAWHDMKTPITVIRATLSFSSGDCPAASAITRPSKQMQR